MLFILACQFLGRLLALLLKPTATAVSIGTLMTSPAFGFMGVGFPRLGMGAFAYGCGSRLPGTWYLMARIDQTVRGTPLELAWSPWPPALVRRLHWPLCRIEASSDPRADRLARAPARLHHNEVTA